MRTLDITMRSNNALNERGYYISGRARHVGETWITGRARSDRFSIHARMHGELVDQENSI